MRGSGNEDIVDAHHRLFALSLLLIERREVFSGLRITSTAVGFQTRITHGISIKSALLNLGS